MLHIHADDFQNILSADPLVNMYRAAVAAVNQADDEDNEKAGEAYHAVIDQIGRAASTQDPVDVRGVIVRLGYVLGSIDRLVEATRADLETTEIVEEMEAHLRRSVNCLAKIGAVNIHGEGIGFHHV
ncbi:hypothetical protein [Gellertiella hungarica]|uniref:Uncharacterized protein n=1 Tax=Gellertiella hungarica TaxID=1572859 RepID=A0A7W6J8Z5_9HYPH|nr:hypothetical protein [Gellertiella hungarica]MBB4067001.1 hypothetical protein [Gellertiella hungarica]